MSIPIDSALNKHFCPLSINSIDLHVSGLTFLWKFLDFLCNVLSSLFSLLCFLFFKIGSPASLLPTEGGIWTPAAAFAKTDLLDRIQSEDCKFEVIN